jgi:hypothetical protein
MKIDYIDGFMYVTHPTGLIKRYSKEEVQGWLAKEQETIVETQSKVTDINNYINAINASGSAPLVARVKEKTKWLWGKIFG